MNNNKNFFKKEEGKKINKFKEFWPELLHKISKKGKMGAGTDLEKENQEFSFDHEIEQVKLHGLWDTYSKQCKYLLKYSPIKE